MPQPPPKPWKQAVFTAIAQVEYALRGGSLQTQADLQQIQNFLVLQYDAPLGSVVHATPLFEALKRALPDAHVTVAASSMAASVLACNPNIDRCVITADPANNFGRTASALRQLLNSMPAGPSCILTTIGNRRPRLALLSLIAGKAIHAGHTAAPELYDIPLTFRPERGQIEGNLDILRSLGYEVAFCEPRMFFTHQDVDVAATQIDDQNKNPHFPRIAFLTQNSRGQRNQWSGERFAQVITELSRTRGATPIFVGTSEDVDAIELLRQTLPSDVNRGISVAGKTTVSQLAATLAQCDLAISLDTGPFHVARAVGLPGVVLAPAWQNPREWLPVDHLQYRVLRGPSVAAPVASYRMEEISVEQVIDAAMDLIEKFPASLDARKTRIRNALTNRKSS